MNGLFDTQDVPSETRQDTCRGCGRVGLHPVTLTPDKPHYARVNCIACGAMIRWLPKPENERIRRSAGHKDLAEKYGRGFCELCLRTKDELRPRETFIGHHVDEYRWGGDPGRENVWVICTACHALVHLIRTYHGGRRAGGG